MSNMWIKFAIVYLLFILTSSVSAQTLTDSNLPIVIINTDGGVTIPDSPRVKGSMKIINRGGGQRNNVTDKDSTKYLNYNGRIDIEIRGSSSQWGTGKMQYGFTTRMEDDITNNNISLLGMPAENDWILNGMVYDPALIRDYLCFNLSRQIGEYASRTAYCELIINGAYQGLYLLEEKIKADNNRVNVVKIGVNDVNLPELTGGYITKADKTTPDDPVAWTMSTGTGGTVDYIHELPKPENVTTSQHNYIHSQFASLDAAAQAGNTSLSNGFPSIIDIPSFINYMIISEISSNADSYQLSTYFHKDRNGKLRAGPIWDSDLTFGNDLSWWEDDPRSRLDVWQFSNEDNVGSVFWYNLFNYAQFRCYLSKRWNQLIQPGQPLNLESLEAFIDQTTATIGEGVARDFALWGIDGTHKQYIADIKTFLAERIPWITANLGPCSSCTNVPVPPIVITKIMYHPEASIYATDNDDHEFMEITNNSDKTIDLTGIYFGGTGFVYQFPINSSLGPHNSAFLASNSRCFQLEYGFTPFGQFTRHLSNKSENLLLLDAFGNIIDNVSYSDSIPWPNADGNGCYLKLSDIGYDNTLPSSWEASKEAVIQAAYLNVSDTAIFLEYEEGSRATLDIGSNTSWTILCSETWLSVSDASGSGNTTIIVTAQKNQSVFNRNAFVILTARGLPERTVIVTQQGSPTGIKDDEYHPIKIYPNPAKDLVTLNFGENLTNDLTVSVIDELGKPCIILKDKSGNYDIKQILDLTQIKSGLYFIVIKSKNSIRTYKIVKE